MTTTQTSPQDGMLGTFQEACGVDYWGLKEGYMVKIDERENGDPFVAVLNFPIEVMCLI